MQWGVNPGRTHVPIHQIEGEKGQGNEIIEDHELGSDS